MAANYTASIDIAVRGQQAIDRLNQTSQQISTRLDEIARRRIGPNTSLNGFNRQLDIAARNLNRVTAGTTDETNAVTAYVQALGLASAARQRHNNLIEDQILREQGLTEELIDQARALRDLAQAEDTAAQARNARLAHYARMRGTPEAYQAPIGPVQANIAGAANLQEVADAARDLADAERYIADIRDTSLQQSIRLETERLNLARERRKEEEKIRDAVLDAVTFGKSADVKNVLKDVQTGTQNALIRGGLTAGTLALGKGAAAATAAAGGVAAGMTAHTGPLAGIQNVAGEAVVNAVGNFGDAFNSALGGVPEIIGHILQGIGDIPTAMGAAVVAAMAFGPAMKTAAEATYEAGKAVGNTGLGKAVKETLDSQTNLFEDVVNAASTMNMTLEDTTALELELGKVQIDNALENMTFQKKQNALEKEYNAELARSVKIIRDRAAASRVPVGGFKAEGPLESPSFKSTKKSIGKLGESLALGAGFPLLFGGGAGSVLGSALGSFVGTGFGGQILGGALGQALDQAVAAAARLGNALALVGDNFSKLREDGIYLTAELERQARILREQGKPVAAQNLLQGAVTAQTGDIGGIAARGAGASVNELQKAWNGVLKAVQTTVGIIGGPFAFVLSAVLRVVQDVFAAFNLIATTIGNILNLIPGARQLGQTLYEQSLKGTEEYENQLAELDKQIKSETQLVELAKVRTSYLEKSLGKTAAQQEILSKEADAAERLKKFEQEIAAFRASAPTGTSALRQKAVQQEAQMRFKFVEQEKQEALKNAQSIYQAVQDNNKKVADAQRQYQQQYADMVRQTAREQADIDLQAARALQDARMRMREQDLDYVQKTRREELRTQELLNKEAQLNRSLTAALSSQPEQAELINTVQTAVETWRTGRLSVEQEAQTQQEKAQLEYAKAQIQIERYKYDNALRIARANENSQLTISRINADMRKQNETASKNEYERQLASVKAVLEARLGLATAEFYQAQDLAAPKNAPPEAKQAFETAKQVYNAYAQALETVKQIASTIKVNKLQELGPAPTLTDTSGNATAAQKAAEDQALAYKNQITALEKINGLKQQDLELAKALLAPGADYLSQFNSLVSQQEKQRKYQQGYLDLLRAGVSPELAEQLATINLMEDALLTNLSTLISTIEAYNDPALNDILDKLIKVRQGVATKADEARAGVKPEAVPGQKLQEFISGTQAELQDLEALAVRVSDGIGNAIGNSMAQGITGLIEGTQTAQEVFANFLKSMGDLLIQEGTRMIAMYIAIGVAKAFAGLAAGASGSGGGGGATAIPSTGTPAAPTINGLDVGSIANLAANGAYWSGGFRAFANGGMVTRPTLGLIGEGGEPEYVIPASKMSAAMSRYASGARGSSVIPQDGDGAMAGGGGSTFTLETVVINNVEYATVDQVRAMGQQAASQGAQGGFNKSMRTLQNSRSQRARIGLR